ncbi:methionine synthase [Spirochaetia bacterium]|nr:methionine synthase [Spirochaetia bacterium]
MNTRERLNELADKRILILDGAMGSLIQRYRGASGQLLTEKDFRGVRFAGHKQDLLGCNDLLCLTKPEIIASIHEAYLDAGADIIETCSFNSTAVSLADYGIGELAYEISAAAAALARKTAEKFSTPEKIRFVAGSMGPTAKSTSISPDMNDPGKRAVTWDELEAAYYDNARGLLDGGADLLLVETIYDTLNAKAALFAISRLLTERKTDVPIMISATAADTAGRLLAGQTLEAFCVSVLHARPWSLGLNCSFGAERLMPHIRELARCAPCLVSAHPNAGMPNSLGEYDETPELMANHIEAYMKEGLVNIVGGCCGSTPVHIAAIAGRARNYAPRIAAAPPRETVFAGVEPLRVNSGGGLIKIGERTNVAGCRKFLKLINEGNYHDALSIVREMIGNGAAVINIGMDDPLLDAGTAMGCFLNLALSDPDIARLPVMIDSSRWEVIEGALKCIQGKALVNSISLKEGEGEFLRRARVSRLYGAAVVVMLFDERGQAAAYERKIEIARRAYALLTGDGFSPGDIVFDPNVLAVVTGISEHDAYALNFIRACSWIREHCPGTQISGGISNLSFSFRGNDTVREAMHAVFLKHAAAAGLTMAIVNPGALIPYEAIDVELRNAIEDVILCRETGNTAAGETPADRLLALAEKIASSSGPSAASRSVHSPDWRSLKTEDRLIHAMIKGIDDFIEADVLELRRSRAEGPEGSGPRSLGIVEGPLMTGMREVGRLFGAGKMYLPQVIRSARVMKKAVAALEPFIQREKTAASVPDCNASGNARVLLATVKGDVHDIGKNILAVVLSCNGYEIIDLGVMVSAEKILETAEKEGVQIIGLSGLITPSLEEMVHVAREMENRGLSIPLLIGGATTSLAHTSLRIAPEYSGPVVYVPDAGRSAEVIRSLLSEHDRARFLEELEKPYREAAERHEALEARREALPLEEARKNRVGPPRKAASKPKQGGIIELNGYPLDRVIPHIDWAGFTRGWDLGTSAEASDQDREAQKEVRDKLLEDAHVLLDKIRSQGLLELRGVIGFFPARSQGEDIVLYQSDTENSAERARFSFLRSQDKKRTGAPNPCLADFIIPANAASAGTADWLGLFALSAGFGLTEAETEYRSQGDDYGALLLASLANSLAEAFSEEVHRRVREEFWGCGGTGIRPAFGYPACPDHRDKEIAFKLLEVRERSGLELTESSMIIPAASVCGMYFADPAAYYFGIGGIGEDQLRDWAGRKGISLEEARRRAGKL